MSKDKQRERGPHGAEGAVQDDDEYSSLGRRDRGEAGFTGGEHVGRRDDFAGRENVTEERQDRAIPAVDANDDGVSRR
jgi:hypothetical protein